MEAGRLEKRECEAEHRHVWSDAGMGQEHWRVIWGKCLTIA